MTVFKTLWIGDFVFDIDFQNSPMSKYFAHSFWLFLFDNGESLLLINILYCWAFHHKFCTFLEELITFVHVCSCHCKWRCLKLSPHIYNTKGTICGWSLACPIIRCTSIAHGKIPVHRRLDFPFGLSLLWEILSCSFQTQIEFCKCL